MQEERGEGPEGHSARVLYEAEPRASKNSSQFNSMKESSPCPLLIQFTCPSSLVPLSLSLSLSLTVGSFRSQELWLQAYHR